MPKVKCSYKPCSKRVEREDAIRNAVQSWCSTECQFAHAMALRDKARKAKEKQEKAENRRRKKEFYAKDIKTRRKAAVYWCNLYIRKRDSGNPCISCGTTSPSVQYHASHYITAASCTALRFDERNIHLACARCNSWLSGNLRPYRVALIKKLGQDVVDFLEGPQPKIKITAEWYKSIEDKYKAKCKELEREKSGLPLQHPPGERGSDSPDQGQAQVAGEGLGEGRGCGVRNRDKEPASVPAKRDG